MKQRTFVDSVKVYVKAGTGGNGSASLRREKFVPKGGPDGGDGGNGGDVIFRGDRDEDSLIRLYYTPHQSAESGGNGAGQKMTGRSGKDLVIRVPCGTEIWNAETGILAGEILSHGQEFVAARGGRGGRGNCHWKTSTHQTPTEFTEGQPGEEATLRLELKLIADIGLVGFPNAGKSSLLAAISDAHPKIAAYPFTTLNPIIGTMVSDNYTRIKAADIPGLIKDAHDGTGLGHDFLRHIERAPFLAYVIDMAGVDGRNPWTDYSILRKELEFYQEGLASRPSLVVANKMDLPEAKNNLTLFRKKTKTRPVPVSALTGDNLDKLREAMLALCAKKKKPPRKRR